MHLLQFIYTSVKYLGKTTLFFLSEIVAIKENDVQLEVPHHVL